MTVSDEACRFQMASEQASRGLRSGMSVSDGSRNKHVGLRYVSDNHIIFLDSKMEKNC